MGCPMHTYMVPTRDIVFALCKGVDTAESLGVWLRFKYDDHSSYLDDRLNPRDYSSADSFASAYLVKNAFRKWKALETGIDTKEAAIRSFTSSEETCRETNLRIRRGRDLGHSECEQILWSARRKIAAVLGPYSTFHWFEECGWGNGATSSISKRRALPDTKMCELPISVTRGALPYIRRAIAEDLHWSYGILGVFPDGPFCFLPEVFSVVPGSTLDTVPKTAKVDRVIAKEPTANGFLQKGVGSYIRRRLLKFGIDLDDQRVNQSGAKRASSDKLATIDLEAASDSISLELVYELLPVDWALCLDELRSQQIKIPGSGWVRLEKFSSMGNGFTFELESLIFWAVCKAACEVHDDRSDVLVYGDDIVVNQSSATHCIEALSYLGFKTNTSKTFLDGLFFESCGQHYFDGSDVTPFYQKERVTDIFEVIRLHNRAVRWAIRQGGGCHLDARVLPLINLIRRKFFDSYPFFLPLGAEGDDGFLVEEEIARSRVRSYLSWPVARRAKAKPIPMDPRPLLALNLRRPPNAPRSISKDTDAWDDRSDDWIVLQEGTLLKGRRAIVPLPWEFGLRF